MLHCAINVFKIRTYAINEFKAKFHMYRERTRRTLILILVSKLSLCDSNDQWSLKGATFNEQGNSTPVMENRITQDNFFVMMPGQT